MFSAAMTSSTPTTSPPVPQPTTINFILFGIVCVVYKYDKELYIDNCLNNMIGYL